MAHPAKNQRRKRRQVLHRRTAKSMPKTPFLKTSKSFPKQIQNSPTTSRWPPFNPKSPRQVLSFASALDLYVHPRLFPGSARGAEKQLERGSAKDCSGTGVQQVAVLVHS